jgi:hypothetical protein
MVTSNRRRYAPALAIVALVLVGCGESDEVIYDRGYSDGYAVGYNSKCANRTTLISADWDNGPYTDGYNTGYSAGLIACERER